jgi:uncharacterized protein (DUF58 family)
VTLQTSSHETTQRAANAAHDLAARLPRLTLEARRISATLTAGLHGRRRAGPGENFWQYRALASGESFARVDWRRSARHADQLYVREREWEAAHSIYLFIDRSASMQFGSDFAIASKQDRAITLGLALADCLVKSGERVALLGLTRPLAQANIIDRFAEALLRAGDDTRDLPKTMALPQRAEVVLITDALSPLDEIEKTLAAIQAHGASAHLARIIDPTEESFPFDGETELLGVESDDHVTIGDASLFGIRYRAAFQAHGEALAELCRKKGASLITHRTDRPASDALQALVARITEHHPERAGQF